MRILQVNHGKLAQQEDSYAFKEDSSSESLSPDQLHSEESQCSAEALTENKSSPALTNTDHGSQSEDGSTQNQEENMTNSQETPPIPVPAPSMGHHTWPSGEQQSSCASSVQSSSSSSSPVKSSSCNPSISPLRTGPLPADLDDLKVSELRQQLRMRGLAVSGTKTALIERLRPFRDSSCASPAAFPVTPTGSLSSYHFYPFCSSGSTPPISPASSELSVSSFSDATVSSPQFGLSADEGPDPEKDKMLVEKQKVIEELRWKLQQEQRQVEELRLQLHKRKRMQDCPAPHLQQFYGVSVKQEQMEGGCMAHCDLLELQSSGSPAGLSALLSPQCSPEDSRVTKPSSSPPSPDSHTLLQSASRGTRSTQLQQKSCSYPPDQRNLQTLYHQSPSENSVSARGSTRAKSAGRQQNEALSLSPRHVEPKSPTSSTAFCSSDPPASGSKGPPRYEDAVKQQMSCSQQMDELLDVLIESGEMPANAKEERSPVTKVVPHLTVSPKFHRHYSQVSPSMLWSDHGDAHLEPLLSRTQGDAALLKMPAEDGFTKISAGTAEGHGLGMTFAESPWETMEWLDLIPPSSANASHSGLPPSGPSIFNTELLDETDISLHLEHCFVSSGM
ncbi:myocardin-like [Sinocyclocheilus anshuiensis]|uniref:myocardin-like n=1 Tax=Sinocyclocheilus anshuiensis TaxID=1608454 RepID=UPI0007B78FD0|nr:PREDICTED: myocardin-like [Sinocyclocheilus anshuiensis]